uniref:Uncharacterized protein n=1 Tax=Romanomermis culicivorax TaxID=13658 RepID=A0A915LDK2_ROMCU
MNDVFMKPTDMQNINVDKAVQLKLKSRNAALFGIPESGTVPDLKVVRCLLSMPSDDNNFEPITPTAI